MVYTWSYFPPFKGNYFGVDITLGASTVIASDIDGNRQMTCYILAGFGINYTLPLK